MGKQQREIKQMPMVGKELIKTVLQSFDSEERRLARMSNYLDSAQVPPQHGELKALTY